MKRFALILFIMLAAPLGAVEPDEVLDDPVLETRARALSEGLRCPVCRNESIDESNAGIARDLRLALRARLLAGDSDDQAVQYLVDRYGEYILLRPQAAGVNWVLWLSAPVLLVLGAGLAFGSVRGRARAVPDQGLSAEEQARLDALLHNDTDRS